MNEHILYLMTRHDTHFGQIKTVDELFEPTGIRWFSYYLSRQHFNYHCAKMLLERYKPEWIGEGDNQSQIILTFDDLALISVAI